VRCQPYRLSQHETPLAQRADIAHTSGCGRYHFAADDIPRAARQGDEPGRAAVVQIGTSGQGSRMRTPGRNACVRQSIGWLLCGLCPGIATLADETASVPRFSQMAVDGAIAGWRSLRPSPGAADTAYSLVNVDGQVVLHATARASMSGLLHELRIEPGAAGILRWRWRITAPVAGADMTRKAGDDYAARLYVLFDYPRSKLSFTTRAKLRMAEALHGEPVPTAALNYVWDNRQPIGTIRPNAYTDRAQMVVVESGARRAGQWVEETRDLRADFKAAFGEEAPAIVGIALATDTDNTGEDARAWYGDIALLPP